MIDDKLLRRALGGWLTQILGDQRQREINPGGDASRGPHRAIADEDPVGLDVDLRIGTRELGGTAPMRRRAPAVEQACGGEDEGARADARDPPCPAGSGTNIGQGLRAGGGCARAPAAGDDQRVERIVDQRLGDQLHARRTRNRPGGRGDHPQPVGWGRGLASGRLERRYRSGRVEQLEVGENQYSDVSCHGVK
jgi:hypothetical protein